MNLEGIDEPASAILTDMYQFSAHRGSDGLDHEIQPNTRVSEEEGRLFYEFARKSTQSLEIGLAYGFSTAWIMAGCKDHTAIDPYQYSVWHGIGATWANRIGKLRLIEEPSILALTALLRERRLYDFIFIDGNHRFDDVLVDFYVSDQLCRVGGTIIFHDMWMPSVQYAAEFITKNRAYACGQEGNVFVAAKMAEDNRSWDHFCDFGPPHPVAPPSPCEMIAASESAVPLPAFPETIMPVESGGSLIGRMRQLFKSAGT